MRISSSNMNMASRMLRLPESHRFSKGFSSFTRQGGNLCALRALEGKKIHLNAYRLANTSSGIYAPSTFTSSRLRGQREPHENHLVNALESSDHLPKLPVPNLAGTVEKLKESISPVAMNSAEFVSALRLIDKFSQSAGVKLDLLLREKAAKTKNWMTHDWWVNGVYLRSRKPLVINSNPSMIYPILPFEVSTQRALIETTARLISGVIEFKFALIHGYNPEATSPENEFRLDPTICYDQYKYLFGSTRLPGESVDTGERESLLTAKQGPFSIVISFKGKFFEVQLEDIENENNRIEAFISVLNKIISSYDYLSLDEETACLDGAGVLTSANRSEWAKAYKLLDTDSMETLKKAQFVVCLDTVSASSSKDANDNDVNRILTSLDEGESASNSNKALLTAPVGSESYMAALARQVLHGDSENIGNRWFDKSLQLIVVTNEATDKLLGAGINYEHSVAEGTVVAKLIEYSYDKTVEKSRESAHTNFFSKQVSTTEPSTFRQLRMFNQSDTSYFLEQLKQAKQNFISHVGQFDLSYLDYKRYGKNSVKSWCYSPDSWFQVALQAAYYTVHKRLGPCYESASTSRFAYGRTETIRSLTKEVAQFCLEPSFDTLQSAVKSHKAYSLTAVNGEAIDRVLMGYKMVFDELKTKNWSWGLPESLINKEKVLEQTDIDNLFSEDELALISAFFSNELIKRSTRFALSTSQVSSIHPDICTNYGPILADGYGCCYNITGQKFVAAITANSENQSFSCEVHELKKGIINSLNTMRDIVEEQRFKNGKN